MESKTVYKIQGILLKTERAFLAKFLDGREIWVPKRYCELVNGTTIKIPLWLEQKIKMESSR